MTTEPTDTTPSEQMRRLTEALTGTWQLSGEASGTVRYEPMPGGSFLLQHVDLTQSGHHIVGLEVIGHLRPFMGESSPDVWSRFYAAGGDTLDYVYEIDGATLTIWGGSKGSPAYFRGDFDERGEVLDGAWVFPGGGGYRSTATRVR